MTVNERLDRAIRSYGHVTIDYFPSSNQWRLWFQGCHQHRTASYGDLCAYGNSVEDALDRLEKDVARNKVYQGHCDRHCPKYCDDLY